MNILNVLDAIGSFSGAIIGIAAVIAAYNANRLFKNAQRANERTHQEMEEKYDAIRAEDKKAEEEREKQRKELEEARSKRDQEQYEQLIASGLQAWWVKNPQDNTFWGIMIQNSTQIPSCYYNVKISAISDASSDSSLELSIGILPPGLFFSQSIDWILKWPRPLESTDNLEPVFNSPDHYIDYIEFQDALGKKWRLDPKTGLKEIQADQNKA